ncbi:50S ribosomal protein L24 [Patescibacteria group bacterium]|nr:50S ribosomal protein L24 [Patescibacteria group bacterium]
MKIKSGDKIKVITGKDKGKTGKVLQLFSQKNRASVDGVNLLIKHIRPNKSGEKGQRVEYPAPMNLSNMMLICPKCKKTTRVGYIVNKVVDKEKEKNKEKKVRVCKKCKESIN